MLLQTLPFFGNKWCDKCFLISRFMKGIFVKTPPKPRYHFTWDVSIVLKYLSSLNPLEKLSLKLLTFKVVALVALAAAPRAQTMVALSLNHMFVEKTRIIFLFSKLLKTSKKGQSYSLCLEHFSDESLCVMHSLLYYISVTKEIRKSQQVFISYATYNSVTTTTIARWLRTVLELSGINTSVFKAHSFRGASVSAAFSKGCSLHNILRTADWKSDKNFYKFYNRISLNEKSFSDTVFSI